MSSSATLLMSANAALSMNSSARPQLSRYREMYTLRMIIMKILNKFKLYGTALVKPDLHSMYQVYQLDHSLSLRVLKPFFDTPIRY